MTRSLSKRLVLPVDRLKGIFLWFTSVTDAASPRNLPKANLWTSSWSCTHFSSRAVWELHCLGGPMIGSSEEDWHRAVPADFSRAESGIQIMSV